MQVKDLKPRAQVDEITVTVLKLLQDRKVRARFSHKQLWLQEFRVKDDTGEATLVLWEEDCGQVQPEDVIKVKNGYVLPEKSARKFTTGKYGSMEVL
jgi:ssDNA-binding replication factor A large subunit